MKHMQAQTLSNKIMEQILNDEDYVIEEKIKGVRAFIYLSTNGLFSIQTRGGHNITRLLPHLNYSYFIKHPSKQFGNSTILTFDCELYCKGMDDAEIAGLLNPNRVDIPNTNFIVPYIFDVIKDTEVPLKYRKEELLFTHHHLNPDLKIILHHKGDKEFKLSYYDNVIKSGGEGVMFKNLNSIYTPGKRPSKAWYKLKKFITEDVVIMGFTEGKGKYKNQIGAIIYGQKHPYLNKYLILGQVSGMDDNLRLDMSLNREKYINNVIEIKTSGRTKNMSFEHPSFIRIRYDKNPEECIIPHTIIGGK